MRLLNPLPWVKTTSPGSKIAGVNPLLGVGPSSRSAGWGLPKDAGGPGPQISDPVSNFAPTRAF
jgi:hypothetical protein